MAVSNLGMAAHIVSASGGPGARRVRHWPAEQIRSYDNGIWACHHHGTLIDTDEVRFTIELLQEYKRVAERLSEVDTAEAIPELRRMFVYEVQLNPENLVEATLADAFNDAGVEVVWGREVTQAVRDLVYELVQNALTHGGASKAVVRTTAHSVVVEDDGNPFDFQALELNPNPRGGAYALQALRKAGGERIILRHAAEESGNRYWLQYIGTIRDLEEATPCCVDLDDALASGTSTMSQGCERIFVIFPRAFGPSRAFAIAPRLKQIFGDKPVTVVVSEVSRDTLSIIGTASNVTVLDLPHR